MEEDFYELCDNLDAAIFTGDSLEFKENRSTLEEFLARWQRELTRVEESNKS